MLQWLRLTVFLFLCAAVHGRELECYEEVVYSFYCTNATNQQNAGSICLVCKIVHQELSESDEVIFIDIKNHTTDAKVVLLNGGDVNKLPIFIQKKNNKQITEVELSSTNTHVLNSQFFGNSCENLIKLGSEWNLELAVEAFAFQNCKNLEFLDLSKNRNSSNIAPDAFRGLHKLIKLNLNFKGLSFLLTDWFQDLNNLEALRLDFNKLPEIPENAFKALTKLKQLEIGGNEIEIITRNMFKHNEQLQIVYLNNNKIKEIQTGSFKHLSQLTELNLAKNICVDKEFKGKTLDEIAKELTECYPTSSCVIPQTQNGIIVSIDDDLTQVPGDFYETSGLVKVVCDPTFTQIHDKANQTTNRCVKTNWEDQQWPTCQSE